MYSFNFYETLYNNEESNTLGGRIKIERNRKGLSQYDLSKLTNIERAAISQYELNNIFPSKDTFYKLGVILDLDYICCDGYSRLIISDFSNELKFWRLNNNLSIANASKYFNTDRGTYDRWEKGIFNISKEKYYDNKNLIDSILD